MKCSQMMSSECNNIIMSSCVPSAPLDELLSDHGRLVITARAYIIYIDNIYNILIYIIYINICVYVCVHSVMRKILVQMTRLTQYWQKTKMHIWYTKCERGKRSNSAKN